MAALLYNGVNSERQYFGDGTKLTVLEGELTITSPEVAIFPPSKQEIKEKGKATLVCLATKFYPDHIKLVWQVNDAEREDGVRTDEFSTWHEKSKSYSLTSRLRISTKEWFNSKNSFRCAVKFHLDEIQYKVIRGGDGCGITEDSYMRSGNSTKLTYLMLLWKAMLYALLASALVWRVKAGDKLSRE
ncbi:T cell receptor beta chain MC.7.G5 [Chelonia mydas]|uniref:T cell receptor beta chain MC.7.G5 n=1 Tax=Chelonia mydas TaxID=8469 RepID=UPI001CA8A7CE|nr:T cell receptor beta chain MC.7.G5 [Chelonia mydas]